MLLRMIVCCTLPLVVYNYENIALHKRAWQLNPYRYRNYTASLAVDGLKTDLQATASQCTISEENYDTAIWWVDLGDILGVHHITIYYRTDNVPWGPLNGYVPRFLGFSVYISNTTDRNAGVLCFKDNQHFTKYTIPAVITLNCTHHGRFVIYYNNRTSTNLPSHYSKYAFNELCEFEVYGCSNPNYFGKNCSQPCPVHCNSSRCHIETGHCFECVDGYQGPACEQQCQNNTYGAGCSENCGQCMDGGQCNPVNGNCPNGCEAGFHDFRCKTECQNNMYGAGCSENCGQCMDGEQCNPVNGTCPNGCEAGFHDFRCKTECPSGMFGINCLQNCSENCYNESSCNGKTGACLGGCISGWMLPVCTKECDDGMYGTNCSSNCGHCYQGQLCDKKTGACLKGCGPRHDGIYCNKTCPRVYYGPNCDLLCNSSCYKHRCDYGNCRQENEENGARRNQSGDVTMYICIGGSAGVLSVIAVTVILYKRHYGKKNHMPSTASRKSKKQPNNEEVSSQYDDNIQGLKCHTELSLQTSEYYCELPETEYNDTAETEYNDTATENIYEAI